MSRGPFVLLSMWVISRSGALQYFSGSTGYGHNDAGGREALDQAFAEIVGAEAAIVRSQVSIKYGLSVLRTYGI